MRPNSHHSLALYKFYLLQFSYRLVSKSVEFCIENEWTYIPLLPATVVFTLSLVV